MNVARVVALAFLAATSLSPSLLGQTDAANPKAKPRARDLGIPFDGIPALLNSITDIPGVEVGYTTLIQGEGKRVVGKGPVRTGVTAILPRGKSSSEGVFAAFYSGNGNGDMTGTHWVDENGVLETPILITNTLSVGVVRDAAVEWMVEHDHGGPFWYPIVAETADVRLNDMKGQMLRSLPISSGASPNASASALAARAQSKPTDPATSSLPSRPPTPVPMRAPALPLVARLSPPFSALSATESISSSWPPSRPLKKPWTTPLSPQTP